MSPILRTKEACILTNDPNAEMGLGKTVQTVAMIGYLTEYKDSPVYICIYVHVCVCIYVCVCVCVCVYIHIYVYIYIYM